MSDRYEEIQARDATATPERWQPGMSVVEPLARMIALQTKPFPDGSSYAAVIIGVEFAHAVLSEVRALRDAVQEAWGEMSVAQRMHWRTRLSASAQAMVREFDDVSGEVRWATAGARPNE